MDLDEFRSILMDSKVDVWTLIETAISVAAADYDREFKRRRDAIVERLYSPVVLLCRNCDGNHHPEQNGDGLDKYKHQWQTEVKDSNGREVKRGSFSSPESLDRVEEDDEQRRIIALKEHLEDPHQSEDCLVDLLRSLAHMDLTFKTLKETDIGRHVNRLRKHSSNEVRRLVKQLVRKWKDLVDEWVRLNTPGETAASLMGVADGDSPRQNPRKSDENDHHQVFEQEIVVPQREASARPLQSSASASASASASHVVTPHKQREVKESPIDTERLASATKRLHENYQEAQNAKRQRTVQVMDLHDIPKPKNTFFAKNRGGVQAKHW